MKDKESKPKPKEEGKKPSEPVQPVSPLTTTEDDGIVGGRPDDRNPPKKP